MLYLNSLQFNSVKRSVWLKFVKFSKIPQDGARSESVFDDLRPNASLDRLAVKR